MSIGFDLLSVSRMEPLLRNKRFMERVFTPCEREYIEKKGKLAAGTAAGIFCAKEAYIKASGGGSIFKIPSVMHTENGRPYFEGIEASLSITHDKGIAGAVVIFF